MRVIQPSVAKRIPFATWARQQGLNRHSSATWTVGEDVEVPENLLVGAQIDGKAYEPSKPKRTRTRKTSDRGVVEEPAPPLEQTDKGFVANEVDYPQGLPQGELETKTQEDD